MKTQGSVEYQDFIDFVKIIKNHYGLEKGRRLTQGEFVRKMFKMICNADIDKAISESDETLSAYLNKRSIYGGTSEKLLASVNAEKFSKWIENKDVSPETFKRLRKDCRTFIEERPLRFRRTIKKELLKLNKPETVGDFVAEVFINILSSPDPMPSAQNKNFRDNSLQVDTENEILDFVNMSHDELISSLLGPPLEETLAKVEVISEQTSAIPKISTAVNRVNKKLTDQMTVLDDLKTTNNATYEKIETVAEHTSLTPTIADDVSGANAKLDEIMKFAPKLDRFDRYMDEQANAGMITFIYQLLADKIGKVNPIEFDWMVKNLKNEIDDALNRAVLSRLSDDALTAIEEYMDDYLEDIDGLSALILQKANECGLDLTAITINTLVLFEKLYRGELLADEM